MHGLGTLYLSGGGNEYQSFPLDKFFFSSLSKDGHFLYIPIALRGHSLYAGAEQWMANLLQMHERSDVSFTILDQLPEEISLEQYKAVYIGGGNTWNLLEQLKTAGYLQKLTEYIQAGGVVYGGSAGAIILGKQIDAQDDENTNSIKDIFGANLLNGYSVTCHVTSEKLEKYKEWSNLHNSPILCLAEDGGVVVKDNIITCVGASCTIFYPDGTERIILPEETFSLL